MTIHILFHTGRNYDFKSFYMQHIASTCEETFQIFCRTIASWSGHEGQVHNGWFYNFKRHLMANDKGDIIQWELTPGNVDDREPLKNKHFTEKLFEEFLADASPVGQVLFEMLFVDDRHLMTKVKKN